MHVCTHILTITQERISVSAYYSNSYFVSQGERGDAGPPGPFGPKGDGYPGPPVHL